MCGPRFRGFLFGGVECCGFWFSAWDKLARAVQGVAMSDRKRQKKKSEVVAKKISGDLHIWQSSILGMMG